MNPLSFDVTDADFDTAVIAASHDLPVIVDFWAPWCQPCRMLKPVLEKLAQEYGGRFRLAKINSDDNPRSAQRCAVRGIPAVKAFVGGEPIDEFTGALPEAQVRQFIDRCLPSPALPFREAAAAARAAGDLAAAAGLLDDARAADPRHVATLLDAAEVRLLMAELAEATDLLDAAEPLIRDSRGDSNDPLRLDALRARVNLARSGGACDVSAIRTLRAHLAQAPDDLPAHWQVANALALAGDYRTACEHFLAMVQADRGWQDEAGRKGLLNLFSLLGTQPDHDDLVREYRVKLARTLN